MTDTPTTGCDTVTQFGESLIQHGELNDRIYLMKLAPQDAAEMPEKLREMAKAEGYSKVFAKVPGPCRGGFEKAGYQIEALVPGFYRGEEDGAFLGLYLDLERQKDPHAEQAEKALKIAREKANERSGPTALAEGFTLRECRPEDAEAMAKLYATVFKTYPFPIDQPSFLKQNMAEDVIYFGIWEGERLVALSSAEMDPKAGNAEMTDFATLPEFRGAGHASALLTMMHQRMAELGIATAYTIARAVSVGMNVTFARAGYRYAGRLINNTQISGGFESMNVWYHPLG
ncbi:MAG: putative beta-lysine N-acetyltransferase [Phycisphaeraceae bacterium]